VIVEHRALYSIEGDVPESYTPTPLGQARRVREGRHITIVGASFMVQEALHAADELVRHGVDAEIIDLRSARPLDEDTILQSVRKTGHLVVADTSWELCGIASEVAALAAEKALSALKAPVLRIALANCPAPVSAKLEQAFYPKASTIARAALATLGHDPDRVGDVEREDHFKGPY
jgi:pyruvate dehydrogenase E1 component beta subunit